MDPAAHRQQTSRAVRDVARETGADVVALWEFPPEDFPAWRCLVGDPDAAGIPADHAEYLALLGRVEADCQRQGLATRRARFTVAEMCDELARRGWPNTPENRAAITGVFSIEQAKENHDA